MNEQIVRLIDQMDQSGIPYQAGDSSMTVTYRDLEYFAKLIVQECADYVQFYYKDHMCEVIAHDMKQHFGVE
jgi:hypothetical protein